MCNYFLCISVLLALGWGFSKFVELSFSSKIIVLSTQSFSRFSLCVWSLKFCQSMDKCLSSFNNIAWSLLGIFSLKTQVFFFFNFCFFSISSLFSFLFLLVLVSWVYFLSISSRLLDLCIFFLENLLILSFWSSRALNLSIISDHRFLKFICRLKKKMNACFPGSLLLCAEFESL